jgi:dTMP kinase
MFITFEGIEGCGKTTLSKRLVQALQERGIPVQWTREPGGEMTAQAIRDILLHSEELDACTETFLFLADRSQHTRTFLIPTLEKGEWVVCDRFTDSTIAYQGYGRGLDVALLRDLNQIATRGLKPHRTFLIDLPVETALKRAANVTRFELENVEFHERIRQGFLSEAQREPDRFHVLDGTQPLKILQNQVLLMLNDE